MQIHHFPNFPGEEKTRPPSLYNEHGTCTAGAAACTSGAASEKDLKDAVANQIGSRILLRGQPREHAIHVMQKLYQGDSTEYEKTQAEQSLIQAVPLPLTAAEEEQLRHLFCSCPIPLPHLSLVDLLSVQIYKALHVLATESQISSVIVEKFCQNWLIGFLYQKEPTPIKITLGYTPDQFTQFMKTTQTTIGAIKKGLKKKKNKAQQYANCKPHFDCIQNGLQIMLKIWETHTFREQSTQYPSDRLPQFTSYLPPAKENPEELYEGMLTYIDFVMCALENTRDARQTDTCVQELNGLKKIIKVFNEGFKQSPQHVNENEEELECYSPITEMQRKLLEAFRGVLQQQKDKRNHVNACQETHQKYLTSGTSPGVGKKIAKFNQSNTTLFTALCRHAHYVDFFGTIIFLFDNYISKRNKEHLTIKTRVIRTNFSKDLFLDYVLESEKIKTWRTQFNIMSLELESVQVHNQNTPDLFQKITSLLTKAPKFKQHCEGIAVGLKKKFLAPAMQFLSEENRDTFLSCFLNFAHDLEEAFDVNSEFIIRYASIHNAPEAAVNQVKIEELLDCQEIYPHVKEFLESLYRTLESLYSQHAQAFMTLIDQLSVQKCREHQQEILEFFENFMLEQMTPACATYMLYQELHFLTQPAHAEEPVPLLETPIGAYLLMENFERYFFEKIHVDEGIESLGEAEETPQTETMDLPVEVEPSLPLRPITTVNIHIAKPSTKPSTVTSATRSRKPSSLSLSDSKRGKEA